MEPWIRQLLLWWHLDLFELAGICVGTHAVHTAEAAEEVTSAGADTGEGTRVAVVEVAEWEAGLVASGADAGGGAGRLQELLV